MCSVPKLDEPHSLAPLGARLRRVLEGSVAARKRRGAPSGRGPGRGPETSGVVTQL